MAPKINTFESPNNQRLSAASPMNVERFGFCTIIANQSRCFMPHYRQKVIVIHNEFSKLQSR